MADISFYHIVSSQQCDKIGLLLEGFGESKVARYLFTFGLTSKMSQLKLKLMELRFGQLLEKIGLVFIPSSGHTASHVQNKHFSSFQDVSLTRVRKSNRHLIRSSMISRSGLSLKDDLDLNPLEINVNNIYTPWTRWSRCKKKCKQVRKRFCTLSAICGSNVLKVSSNLLKQYWLTTLGTIWMECVWLMWSILPIKHSNIEMYDSRGAMTRKLPILWLLRRSYNL